MGYTLNEVVAEGARFVGSLHLPLLVFLQSRATNAKGRTIVSKSRPYLCCVALRMHAIIKHNLQFKYGKGNPALSTHRCTLSRGLRPTPPPSVTESLREGNRQRHSKALQKSRTFRYRIEIESQIDDGCTKDALRHDFGLTSQRCGHCCGGAHCGAPYSTLAECCRAPHARALDGAKDPFPFS